MDRFCTARSEAAREAAADVDLQLSGTELSLLALATANFSAIATILELLARLSIVDPRDLKLIHSRMSSAIDAAAEVAPPVLTASEQAMIDLTFALLLQRCREASG